MKRRLYEERKFGITSRLHTYDSTVLIIVRVRKLALRLVLALSIKTVTPSLIMNASIVSDLVYLLIIFCQNNLERLASDLFNKPIYPK